MLYLNSLPGIHGYSETKLFAEPTFNTTFSGLQDASKYIVEARAFFKEKPHYHFATTTAVPTTTTTTTTTTDAATTTATTGNTTTIPAPRGLRNPLSSKAPACFIGLMNICFSDFPQSANFLLVLQPANHPDHAPAFAWRGT